MPLPIGVSIGDLIAVVELVRSIKKALKDSAGSKAEYEEVVSALKSCEDALTQAEQVQAAQDEKKAINEVVQRTKETITSFENKIRRYEPTLARDTIEKRWKSIRKKIQWQTSGVKEDLHFFQTQLQQHAFSLQIVLSKIQIMAGSQAQQHTSEALGRIEHRLVAQNARPFTNVAISQAEQHTSRTLTRIENRLIAHTAKLEMVRPHTCSSNTPSPQPNTPTGLVQIQHPINARQAAQLQVEIFLVMFSQALQDLKKGACLMSILLVGLGHLLRKASHFLPAQIFLRASVTFEDDHGFTSLIDTESVDNWRMSQGLREQFQDQSNARNSLSTYFPSRNLPISRAGEESSMESTDYMTAMLQTRLTILSLTT